MSKLILGVTYTAKPGMRENFVKEILASNVLEKIRQEDGCLGYDYYFSAEREDEIFLLEKWASKEQQQTHLKQAHMDIIKAIKEKWIVDTKLQTLE